MRIGELARRTGIPVPTIKYYTREGLLPPGERTGPNQVRYGDSHLRRLRLVRAMLDVGGLSVAAAREVLRTAGSPAAPERTVRGVLGAAESAGGPEGSGGSGADAGEGPLRDAEREVDELVRRHGWAVGADHPGRRTLVRIVTAYRDLEQHELLALLDRYADAVSELAVSERELLDGAASAERIVLGSVLGDAALRALRHVAASAAEE